MTSCSLNVYFLHNNSSFNIYYLSKMEMRVNEMDQRSEINVINHQDSKQIYRITFTEIFLKSITSLYFFLLLLLLPFIYTKLENITFTLFLFICFVIIRILLTFVRYGNYTLSINRDKINVTTGGIQKTSYVIERNELHGIVVKKSLLRRFLPYVSITGVCAGNDSEVDILPFIHEYQLQKLLQEIIPELSVEKQLYTLPKYAVFVNLVQPSNLLIFVTFFIFFFWPEYWLIPFILFISFVVFRILQICWTKYRVEEKLLYLQTGVFSTSLLITSLENMVDIDMKQSWLQQKFDLASFDISIRTNKVYMRTYEHIPVDVIEQISKTHEDK